MLYVAISETYHHDKTLLIGVCFLEVKRIVFSGEKPGEYVGV